MNEADPNNWKPADFQKYVDVSTVESLSQALEV